MSTPRNHHYVSQCLIKKFFNKNGKLYYYDKSLNRFDSTTSSKRFFSEKELNSKINDDGKVDHAEIESILNQHFEKDYPFHYDIIAGIIDDDYKWMRDIFESGKAFESVLYLMRMGLIGESRTPQNKIETENIILKIFRELSEIAVDDLKKEFEEFETRTSDLKYRTQQDFKELSNEIIKQMGESVFTILMAPEDSYFLLPDCSSFIERHQLIDDIVIDGVTYLSPGKQIAVVGIPINSRVLIVVESLKISKLKVNYTKHLSSGEVYNLNRILYYSSNQKIACENDEYLKEFIRNCQIKN